VAQQHGGTVTVNSQIGKGTTFHVLLRQDTPGRRDVGLRPNGQDFPHVLVVDDDREVGQTAAALLEYLGCHVTVVDQGSSAIALLRAQPHLIDVVILDMAMTPMDGSSCFRMLHALFPTIPVILSSGFDLNIELAPLFDEGLAGFVQKPYDIQDLFSVLEKVKSGGLSRFPGKVAFSAPSTQGIVSPI